MTLETEGFPPTEQERLLPLTVYCPQVVDIPEMTAFFILQRTQKERTSFNIVTPTDSQPRTKLSLAYSLFFEGNLRPAILFEQIESNPQLRSFINYYTHCRGARPKEALKEHHFSPLLYEILTKVCLIYYNDPKESLLEGARVLQYFYDHDLNPKKIKGSDDPTEYVSWDIATLITHVERELEIQEQKESIFKEGPFRDLKLPVFKTQEPGEKPLEGLFTTVQLNESRIRLLEGRHLRIVVGGPPGAGKSTATPSLVEEMNKVIHSIKAKPGFENLRVTCGMTNLDKATPVSPYVASPYGQDRDFLQKQKREWDEELASMAIREFQIASKFFTISIGDLPGRRTAITRALASSADYAIILTPEWEEVKNWRTFFEEIGVRVLVQARSHLPGEGLESAVRTYKSRTRKKGENNYLGGRVVGFDRQIKEDDPFLEAAAQILLFDFLPQIGEVHRRKVKKMLEKIKENFDPRYQVPKPSRKVLNPIYRERK